MKNRVVQVVLALCDFSTVDADTMKKLSHKKLYKLKDNEFISILSKIKSAAKDGSNCVVIMYHGYLSIDEIKRKLLKRKFVVEALEYNFKVSW